MVKKSREVRDAARVRKKASGQFREDLKSAAGQAAEEPEVEKSECQEKTYGGLIADSLNHATVSDLSVSSSSDVKVVKGFLDGLSEDEMIKVAEPGDGIFDYLQERACEELPLHLRPIANSKIRAARDSAISHLDKHVAPEVK